MKLGYRDRVVLIVAIIVVILGIGIFVFIKPKWEALNKNKELLKAAQEEWDAKLIEFDRIEPKQKTINKRYEESLKIAEEFTDEMDSVQLEEFIQNQFMNTEKFTEDGVTVKQALTVTDEVPATLGYYYYIPNIVTYPLYESADLDGSLALAAATKLLESNILSARTAQSVGTGTSTFTVEINREDTMALLDAVKQYADSHKDAMMISSIAIKDITFNEDLAEDENGQPQQVDEEGNPIPAANNANKEEGVNKDIRPNYTEVTVVFKAFYMQEPTKPDVGPEYDKTIWDGNEWRTAVVE